MKKINLNILVILYITSVVLADDAPRCFQFTWIVPTDDNKPDKFNCSISKNAPCVAPVFRTDKLPTIPELLEQQENTTCLLTTGSVCVKYTFMFNNDIVNISSFCGKIVEDHVSAITSGCYQQQLDGHTIEVCACKTKRGKDICNASVNITYSGFLLLITLLFTSINISYKGSLTTFCNM
ncbi:uncharacterized protein LOC116428838 [Nomia melanderi]|uniref:uncharacterized protein LOC116428838 n=1 Tax=Nomia melanderi TaxID=2448451 RepID=UPI0013042608|nr:uncharacterized protein LOC116428838 [Nomia melanderi]